MAKTKQLKYAPRQRRAPVASPIDPLLVRLRKIAASGKEMTLRNLRTEFNIPPIEVQILAGKYPEVQIMGTGKEHVVKIGPPLAAEPRSEPPRSNPQAEPSISHELTAQLPVKLLPEAPPSAAPSAPSFEPDAHDRLLRECGARASGPRNRHGGRSNSSRRNRQPLVDIETGENLEISRGGLKRRYDKSIYLLPTPALAPAKAKPEPKPLRHRLPQNIGRKIAIVGS